MSDCVLITGASEGIGRGLAARYLATGATVLVTGRAPRSWSAPRETCRGYVRSSATQGALRSARRWPSTCARACQGSRSS